MDASGSSGGITRDRALLAAAVAAVVFSAGVFLPPLLAPAHASAGEALRSFYAPLCHQHASRSLNVAGAPLAVCARCAGAYLGGAAGLTVAALGLGRLGRRKLAWLSLGVFPSVVDVAARGMGYAGLENLARAVIAIPAGAVAGVLLAEGVEDALRMFRQRRESKRRPAWSAATAGETPR